MGGITEFYIREGYVDGGYVDGGVKLGFKILALGLHKDLFLPGSIL